MVEPSTNSTIEWMMLCGCMTISMSSHGTPNSQCASITSNALFISVAESTVIFRPIFQVGCFSACAGVAEPSSSSGVSLNAPPDAVMMSFDTDSPAISREPDHSAPSLDSPLMHCQMALGSLSSGRMSTPRSAARRVTSSPAITMVSLLASAICLPAPMAASVGPMATSPTVAVTTTSTSSSVTSSSSAQSRQPF